jgi:hypothetical protein
MVIRLMMGTNYLSPKLIGVTLEELIHKNSKTTVTSVMILLIASELSDS